MNETKQQENMDDLADLTGEKSGRPNFPKYNQIQLNGQEGDFYMVHMAEPKIKVTDPKTGKTTETYKRTVIGKNLKLIFLKHRRDMLWFRKGEKNYQTSEHNTKTDTVMLYGPNEKGIAGQLWQKYPMLRVRQIIYALNPETKEVVKLLIKGASLGSQNKADENNGYYSYMGSFKNGEHCHQHVTNISVIKEKGDLGSYFCMDFTRGEQVEHEKLLSDVAPVIRRIAEETKQMDAYYSQLTAGALAKENQPMASKAESPEEDINPEDIPF